MKKKFKIECSETVMYEVEVMANNKAEAKRMVSGGEVKLPEAYDSSGFQVDNVTLIK